MSVSEPTALAAILSISMAIVKTVEHLVVWATTKLGWKKEQVVYAQFSPATEQLLKETHLAAHDTAAVVTRTDSDGLPLVYGPREEVRDILDALDRRRSNGFHDKD